MLKKILVAIAAALLLVLLVGLMLSQHYKISRSVTIHADRAKVHALVGDLKRWDEWAPWKDADPTIQVTMGAKTTGVGASQTWSGKSGGGHLTFTQCDPNDGIVYDMAFSDGGKDTPAKSWMTYTPRGDETVVVWGMEGEMDMPLVGGWFALISDRMIGPMFESGLAKLKTKAETK